MADDKKSVGGLVEPTRADFSVKVHSHRMPCVTVRCIAMRRHAARTASHVDAPTPDALTYALRYGESRGAAQHARDTAAHRAPLPVRMNLYTSLSSDVDGGWSD